MGILILLLFLVLPIPVFALDAATIQAKIDALPPQGGTITLSADEYTLAQSHGSAEHFPNGSPIQTAVLINKNNVTLEGQGSGTIFDYNILVANFSKSP